MSLRRADDGVQIAVEDRGEGVPEEDRDPDLQPLQPRQRRPDDAAATDGVGLGLALVAEHVNLHGGTVWVEDRSDGEPGARFVVQLPVEEHE